MPRASTNPLQSAAELAREPDAFPRASVAGDVEHGYADWRQRLVSNLARHSDGRWEPLSYFAPAVS